MPLDNGHKSASPKGNRRSAGSTLDLEKEGDAGPGQQPPTTAPAPVAPAPSPHDAGADPAQRASSGGGALDRPPLSAARFAVLLLGIACGLFFSMLDTSIVATSLYSIADEFKNLDDINWVALAYTLAYLGCAVLFSRISDVVGRRTAFLTAFAIFTAFSLGCGFSQSLTQLIVCRAFQGVGGSGLYGLSLVILTEITPETKLRVISAVIGLVVVLAGVLGPVLGGVLTHYASWRWVFWINGPVGVLAMATFFLSWPPEKHLPQLHRRAWGEVDYLGSVLLIAGAVLVTFSFQNAGAQPDQWATAIFVAPLVLGVACLAALFAWQRFFVEARFRGRVAPAFPLELLRNRAYTACFLHIMLVGFPYLMCIYIFPLYFQVVGGKSALEAGVFLLPMLGAAAVSTVVAGRVNTNKNRIFETLLAACACMILGLGLETTAPAPADAGVAGRVLGFMVLIGFGFGLSVTGTTMYGTLESPEWEHATSQGILAQARILGGTIGIAASTAIQGVKTRSALAGVLSPAQLADLAHVTSTLTVDQYAAVRRAYTAAFRDNMVVCCAVMALTVVVTLGTYQRNRRTVSEAVRKRRMDGERHHREAMREGGAAS